MWSALWIAVAGASSPLVGHYEHTHIISFPGYADAKACEADKMHWKDGSCLSDAADTVDVKDLKGKLTLVVSTVASNAHTCDFKAEARALGSGDVRASTVTDDGSTCEVTVKSLEGGQAVSVTTNKKCDAFCGVSVSLDLAHAKRLPNKSPSAAHE